jgi:hypothetical protein
MATAWKGLNPDGSPCHGGSGKWDLPKKGKPGKWRTEKGPLRLCFPGTLHLSATTYQLLSWLNCPAIYVAEYDEHGPIVCTADEIGVLRSRLLYRCEHWTDQTARLFAADCAEAVLQGEIGKAAIRAARRYAFGLIGDDALAKAHTTAWAIGLAARPAAWATDSPASSAADSAALSAALSAADASACWETDLTAYWIGYAAARKAQAARLHDYLLGKVDLNAIRDMVA